MRRVIRSLYPSLLQGLTARLQKRLLYQTYPEIAASNERTLLSLCYVALVLYVAIIACLVIERPGFWVDVLKRSPMNAEWQGIVHALESWLLLMGFVSSALLGVFAGFLYWVENRARVARLITTLEARFTDTWPLPIVVRLSEVSASGGSAWLSGLSHPVTRTTPQSE